jgi:ribosomal protein L37AE/L43A
VTGNRPLRCSEEGFYRACAGFQKNLTERKRPYNKECGECRGAFVPPEVTFIQVTNFKRGKEMQTTCGFCGKEASVKRQYGDIMVCTSCSIIRSYAKNNPELLEKALVEVGRGIGPADAVAPQEVCAQETEDRVKKLAKKEGDYDADMVNHPPHYTSHKSGVECIQITEHMGFCLGNAVKYIWRADLKHDTVEDLEKSQWYIKREIGLRKKL